MEWTKIQLKEDIDKLIDEFSGFYDSCIAKCSYTTGMIVDKNKNMKYSGDSDMKLVFHSQSHSPIEICFEEIKEANIHTSDNAQYLNDINSATFFMEDGLIYWSDGTDWNKNNTYIICKKVKYRKHKGE